MTRTGDKALKTTCRHNKIVEIYDYSFQCPNDGFDRHLKIIDIPSERCLASNLLYWRVVNQPMNVILLKTLCHQNSHLQTSMNLLLAFIIHIHISDRFQYKNQDFYIHWSVRSSSRFLRCVIDCCFIDFKQKNCNKNFMVKWWRRWWCGWSINFA